MKGKATAFHRASISDNFIKLEDAGKVLVRVAKDKDDVIQADLEQAYKLGLSSNGQFNIKRRCHLR